VGEEGGGKGKKATDSQVYIMIYGCFFTANENDLPLVMD
jgi:hypothetical protein